MRGEYGVHQRRALAWVNAVDTYAMERVLEYRFCHGALSFPCAEAQGAKIRLHRQS